MTLDDTLRTKTKRPYSQDSAPGNIFQRMAQAFWRSARYEGNFLRHNRWDFSVLFWIPLAVIVLVWWIFSRPFIVNLPIGMINDSHNSYSQTLIRYLDASPDLAVTQIFKNSNEANDALLRQQVYAVVIIPRDFGEKINQAQASPVLLEVNAQFGSHSGIIQRGVQSAVGTFSAGVEIKRSIKQGSNPSQAKIDYSPISIQRVSLFNAGSNYQLFLASTVLPALLHILAMVVGATTIGREIRDCTFADWCQLLTAKTYTNTHTPANENSLTSIHFPSFAQQTFVATPHSNVGSTGNGYTLEHRLAPPQHLLNTSTKQATQPMQSKQHSPSLLILIAGLHGKYLWAILAYALWGAVALTLALQLNHASIGAWAVTYVAYLLLLLLSIWLGAIFSLAGYSLRMGLSITGFVSAPSYAFAGVAYPYIAISDSAKYWADALPLTHYLKLHIGLLQMHAPLDTYRGILYGLLIATLVSMLLTALLCKRAWAHPERWGAR
ncbi:ABC transporter permease [Psychrobacter sp. I-STPA6b]|uniref:ABC transporter permease n=1 Tax=Psychrobacter sp. I-STPA6b TaxID=2585718 RepID=UPI001D0C472B|nr:ABC transporter permease [Psychrobacter sp. I-STPA6b]